MKFKIGRKYRIFFDKGNPNNRTIHIRAIVDEEYYVVRYWGKHKRHWIYQIEYKSHLDLLDYAKHIKEVK